MIERLTKSDVDLYTESVALAAFIAAANTLRAERDHAMNIDPKTGLLTALAFQRRVEEITHNRRRNGDANEQHTFALLDLDRFHDVNEALGYTNADNRILIPYARNLKASLRDGDLAGRWGGEEMLLFLPHTSPDDAMHVIGRVYGAAERINFGYDAIGNPINIANRSHLGVSMGIVRFKPGDDYTERFNAANELVHEVKENGRNSFLVEEAA